MRLLSLCLIASDVLAQLPNVVNSKARFLRKTELPKNNGGAERKLQQGEQPVDLNQWFAESYEPVSRFRANWTVADDKLSVFQSVNAQPTLFCSNFSAQGTAVEGRIRVETPETSSDT